MKTTNFIGAVLAGSIAITSIFAAPVAASGKTDNLAKILLGAAAVGLVVYSVKKNKRARRANVARQDYYRPQQPRVDHQYYKPKICLRKRYTYNGWETFYSQRCLDRNRHNHNGGYARTNDRYDQYNRRNTHYANSDRYYKKTYESEK
ncbi:MAG: hypothetical protein JKX71_05875 [Amylibacter sp.]|nr:hypothetical protein [Amylibacter sp.]